MVTVTKILTVAALCLACAVAIAGFVPVSHPALDRAVRKAAYRAGVGACSIGSVKAAFWTGMTLIHISGTVPSGSGLRCAVKAERIVLHGSITRAALNFFMRRQASGPAAFTRDPAAMFRYLHRTSGRSFSGISVSSAVLDWTEEKKHPVRLLGFSMTARFPGADCSGSFTADSLMYAEVPAARRLRGDFVTDGKIARLSGFRCASFGGAVRCSGRADFFRTTLGALTFSINGFDFGEWHRYADTTGGRLSGTADCRVQLDSSALASDSLRGRGTITAAGFGVSGFAIQRTLAGMLAYPALAAVRFSKAAALFTIKPGGIVTTEASGHNDSLAVKTAGLLTIDGRLDQKVECTVAKRAVDGLPEFARTTLEETRDGGRVIRLRIYGTFDHPKFAIDSKAILQKAVRNMFDNVKNNLQEWLKQ
ncbi:MAG: hypothetical protein JW699_08795 [Chitinispirillaceae bacterium]|nr:hypothetical protein [Chitinispirillaceae bacterium]